MAFCFRFMKQKPNRATAASVAQKIKGKLGLMLARLLPMGGEAKPIARATVKTNPVAAPAYIAYTLEAGLYMFNLL